MVPVQVAAGNKGERKMYGLENVVGCPGKKLALSNSSKNWHRISFYCMPRTVVDAVLSKNSTNNNSNNNNN